MANTFTLIEAQTLSSAVSSITLGSGGTIPQTYTDLKIVMSARGSDANVGVAFTLYPNGLSSNLTQRYVYGTGSTTGSATAFAGYISDYNGSTSTSSTFNSCEIYIPNYASANYKSWSSDAVVENNATGSYQNLLAGLWSNVAVITSLVLTSNAGNFVQYSTFYLYGIKNS